MKSLPTLITLLWTATAQRTPVPITTSTTSLDLSATTWSLQNLSVQFPLDAPSILPPEIYPHDASIEFAIFQSKTATDEDHPTTPDGTTVTCKGSWKPGSQPLHDSLCDDGRTYWRFGVLERWQEKDFWVDVWRPNYLLPTRESTTRAITLVHAPIHITSSALLCTTIRLANTIYHCSLSYLPFAAPATESFPDKGIAVNIEHIKAVRTSTPLKTEEAASNFINFRVRDTDGVETTCAAAMGRGEAWPAERGARRCSDERFVWFVAVNAKKTTGAPATSGVPEEANGSSLRIRRRMERSLKLNGTDRPDWKVEMELMYEVPLKNSSKFEWSCKDTRCEGRSRAEELVFLDWKKSTLSLS